MKNKFQISTGMIIWLATVSAIGIFLSAKLENGLERIGIVGIGTFSVGAIVGCFRTGKFFTWDGPIEPTEFEKAFRLTGAALMVHRSSVLA